MNLTFFLLKQQWPLISASQHCLLMVKPLYVQPWCSFGTLHCLLKKEQGVNLQIGQGKTVAKPLRLSTSTNTMYFILNSSALSELIIYDAQYA